MPAMSVRAAKLVIVCALCGVVAFIALRSSSFVQSVPWIPRAIGVWADSHGVVRNTVAFFALGLAAFLLLRPQMWVLSLLCVFSAAIEVAQMWIPGRRFDGKDILASVVGIFLAWPVAWLLHRRRRPD